MSKIGQGGVPLVSIIIVHFDKIELTRDLYDSISNLDYDNVEILIIDNSNRCEENNDYWKSESHVKHYCTGRNLGFAGGLNFGMQKASGEFFLLLNNDLIVQPDLLKKTIPLFEEMPKVGAISPKVCFASGVENDGPDIIQYLGSSKVSSFSGRNKTFGWKQKDVNQIKCPTQTNYLNGVAMIVPKQVVKRVGNLPEVYFMYYEELEWSDMIRAGGYKILVQPQTSVYHKESSSIGYSSPLKLYYVTRNRMLYLFRRDSTFYNIIFMIYLVFIVSPFRIGWYLVQGKTKHLKNYVLAFKWHLSRN